MTLLKIPEPWVTAKVYFWYCTGKEARFKQSRLRNAYCFIRQDLLLKGCWLSVCCLYRLWTLIGFSGNEGQSKLGNSLPNPVKLRVAAAPRWQLGISLIKGVAFGSPTHWMNILATRYDTKRVPVAAVCGRPSSPVYAGISGQVLWSTFLFLCSSWLLYGPGLPIQKLFCFSERPWKYFQLHQGGIVSSCSSWAEVLSDHSFRFDCPGFTPDLFPQNDGTALLLLVKKQGENFGCVLLDSGLVLSTGLPCLPVRSCFRGSFWVEFVSV